jgi:deoxycytidine triphosphate deaminase/intein/homing endonuclease
VILSDQSIREQLEAGGIVIEPLGDGAIQPSSVDLHVDRYFRVFRNDTTPYIDPKQPQENLTELVEVPDDRAFILHPGEFVLGSTLERVALGPDLVARLEGKSSLGRMGLLIHSSLPASETVMVLADGQMKPRPISEVVRDRLDGHVVSFDPDTFEVGYHRITGWYEGPPDRIYEVRLASGRTVRVTAGHNLFTLGRDGELRKTRTAELEHGTRVAIPRAVPDPPDASTELDLVALAPPHQLHRLMCTGPGFPPSLKVDTEVAWLLGFYVAEGYRRRGQVTVSNFAQHLLDRAHAVFARFGIPVYRSDHAITACSALLSAVFDWLGVGNGASAKRVPPIVFGWPHVLVESFLTGLVDGDGSREQQRTSVWTTSEGLAGDLLLLAERLGRRAGSTVRVRNGRPLWQIYFPEREHKLLTSVPLPDRLLIEIRRRSGLSQVAASRLAGYRNPTDLNNLERRTGREAVRATTLRRLRSAYARRPECVGELSPLDRLVDGDLLWDRVVEVRDTGSVEPIFDLEVRPSGRKVENFLAGRGGVFVSNTAGFVDAGWDGHLTLELSNVANLPIAIYPGMKIGQISFLRMTTAAEQPYGGEATQSKYKGQRGPTPSRYHLNFPDGD